MNNTHLVVSGSGRSGTTWVVDAIAEANNLRTVFEPLHPIGVRKYKEYSNQFVSDHEDHPELKKLFDRIFSGRLNSIWANYRVRPDRLVPNFINLRNLKGNYKKLIINYFKYDNARRQNRIIVKFIRANLMLEWISQNFNSKIILMIRHPGAVIASKLKLGGVDWSHEKIFSSYTQDKKIFNNFLYQYKDIRSLDLTPIQAHTAIWCIENMIPLKSAKERDFCVIFYEDLETDGQKEWIRMIEFLGLNAIPESRTISKPSQQASKEMIEDLMQYNRINKWQQYFDKNELYEIESILKVFEVQFYNAFDPMPICSL